MSRSIVVPLFNEEHRVRNGIGSIQSFLGPDRTDYEVVLVDDGSTDATVEIAEELVGNDERYRILSYSENRGKGHAVRVGMLRARGRTRVFCDIDMSVPVELADVFCERVENGHDVVIGTRSRGDSNIVRRQPWLRETLGTGYRSVSRWLFSRRISDFTCGFKAFSDVAATRLFPAGRLNRWAFDTEILFLAERWGYSIDEIPVNWTNEPNSRVRVTRDVIGSVVELASVRLYWMANLYDQPSLSTTEVVESPSPAMRVR